MKIIFTANCLLDSNTNSSENYEKTLEMILNFSTWQKVNFAIAINKLEDMPFSLSNQKAVIFAGRSNVGKSSLINSLTNQKKLCNTSNKPGCTKTINLFTYPNLGLLIDLPGYGYSIQSKKIQAQWKQQILNFLIGYNQLQRIFVLINSLHGIKDNDWLLLQQLELHNISHQIILTKAENIAEECRQQTINNYKEQLKNQTALYPEIILTSSKSQLGIAQLRKSIYQALTSK